MVNLKKIQQGIDIANATSEIALVSVSDAQALVNAAKALQELYRTDIRHSATNYSQYGMTSEALEVAKKGLAGIENESE